MFQKNLLAQKSNTEGQGRL